MIWLLVLVAFLVVIAVVAHVAARREVGASGLPEGDVRYQDTSQATVPCETLVSTRHGLVGRPDYIVDTATGLVPVDLTSTVAPPQGPYYNHVAQLLGYCLLVEDSLRSGNPASRGNAAIRRTTAPKSRRVRCSAAAPIGVTWSPEPKVESDPGSPTNMLEQNLTPEILTAALQGLEAQKARLEAHIAEVTGLLGARPQEPAAAAKAPKPKRKMSAAGRRRMAAGQQRRWAAHRQKAEAATKAKEPAAAANTPRPKRKMSAAGRKRIVAATRKRWAEYHRRKAEAAKGAGKPAVIKKSSKKRAAVKATKPPVVVEGPGE